MKSFFRAPAQLFGDFFDIHRIPAIVSRTIRYEAAQLVVGRMARIGREIIQNSADLFYHLDIRRLVVSADIIGFTGSASPYHLPNCLAVILT